MAISRLGASSIAAATSITVPGTYNTGDYIVIMAFRNSSTAIPALGTGFTNLATGSGNTCGARLGYKIATSSSESSGTWTNGTLLMCQVYTGVTSIGTAVATMGNSSSPSYAGLTLGNTSGSSWIIGMGGHRDPGANMLLPPTGMTNETGINTGTSGHAGGHDTNGGVSSWSTQVVAVGGTVAGWHTFTVELVDGTVTPTTAPPTMVLPYYPSYLS